LEPPRQGHVLSGRYRLGREVGQGAFGRVHEAWDETAGARVAVEVLNVTAMMSSVAVDRIIGQPLTPSPELPASLRAWLEHACAENVADRSRGCRRLVLGGPGQPHARRASILRGPFVAQDDPGLPIRLHAVGARRGLY
jgi:hypothetical protein